MLGTGNTKASFSYAGAVLLSLCLVQGANEWTHVYGAQDAVAEPSREGQFLSPCHLIKLERGRGTCFNRPSPKARLDKWYIAYLISKAGRIARDKLETSA